MFDRQPMNTQAMIFWLVVLLLGIIAALVWLAMSGSLAAVIILTILGTACLISLGYLLAVLQQRAAAAREQRAFMANAKENLDMMLAMQKLQNAQNSQLLKQAQQAPPNGLQLPASSLAFDDGVFSDLED